MANPEFPAGPPERFWQLKPWWCQPWSILTTGIAVPLASWWLLHWWWLTAASGLAVLLWWWLFLVQVPAEWRRMVESQANKTP
ncbi:MAG: DUF6737 family protein [Synechococcaceae cyanobacterium]|nr:DUF6737 family protein [Synechococcaceae cyanobacterium]